MVTGAAGPVGGVLLRGLDARYDVCGVDARRTRAGVEGPPVRRAQLRRPASTACALTGAAVVVHCAELASQDTPWRDVHRNNLPTAWNTIHAASAGGARRLVLASSNAVTGGYEDDHPYFDVLSGRRDGRDPATLPRLTPDAPVRPNGAYAVGKAASEAAGRCAAERLGLSVIVLRLGTVLASDRPSSEGHRATLLTHRDLVHLVEQCIDAPDDLRFAIFHGVSANTWRIWDIDTARDTIGDRPRDDAEGWSV
jgi:nucleoside-diphosphate-sugar epimerase